MSPSTSPPRATELFASFAQHLGPRFQRAAIRIEFRHDGTPGIHFRTPVSDEYKPAIVKGLQEGIAARFPGFLGSGSVWITEVTEHEVDSSWMAFYKISRAIIEQAYALVTTT